MSFVAPFWFLPHICVKLRTATNCSIGLHVFFFILLKVPYFLGLFLPHCSTKVPYYFLSFNYIVSALKMMEVLSVKTGYYRPHKFQRKPLYETLAI